MEEKWIEILEFPNYEVSNLGNVRNKKTKRVKKPQIDGKSGKLKVYLYYGDGSKKGSYRVIHGLVANEFIPNPNGYTDIVHLDGNNSNNKVDNLAWRYQGERESYKKNRK